MRRNILLLIAAAIILGGLSGWWMVQQRQELASQTQPTPTATASVTATPAVVSYKGEDGKNALELLKRDHQVTEETASFGTFVKGIDGLVADDAHYWAFYVNGTYASVGAGAYQTKSTDTIEWKYEAIQ